MKSLSKFFIASAASIIAMTGMVNADNGDTQDVKVKVLELVKEVTNGDMHTKIKIDEGEGANVFVFDSLAMENTDNIRAELEAKGVEQETIDNVMKALGGVKVDGSHVMIKDFNIEIDSDGEGEHEIMVFSDGSDAKFDWVSKGGINIEQIKEKLQKVKGHHRGFQIHGQSHADMISKMIKKGKFTQEDLDKLQAALDEKR